MVNISAASSTKAGSVRKVVRVQHEHFVEFCDGPVMTTHLEEQLKKILLPFVVSIPS